MFDESPVVIKSLVVDSSPETLLIDVAYASYLALQGKNAEIKLESSLSEEYDLRTDIGVPVNCGQYFDPNWVEDRYLGDCFKREFLEPVLGDLVVPANWTQTKVKIRAHLNELENIARGQIDGTFDKEASRLICYVKEYIESRAEEHLKNRAGNSPPTQVL